MTKEQFKKFKEEILPSLKLKPELGDNLNLPKKACTIGENKILIRANGDVTWCAAMKYEDYGNIRENSLKYFWKKHPKIKEFKEFLKKDYQKLKGNCSTCETLNTCKGGCIAQRLYKHKKLYQGPDPLCKK